MIPREILGRCYMREPSLKVDGYGRADVATWVSALFNGRKRCCSIILPGDTNYEHLDCSELQGKALSRVVLATPPEGICRSAFLEIPTRL